MPFSLTNHFDPIDLSFCWDINFVDKFDVYVTFFSLRLNSLVRFLRSGQVFMAAL